MAGKEEVVFTGKGDIVNRHSVPGRVRLMYSLYLVEQVPELARVNNKFHVLIRAIVDTQPLPGRVMVK